MAKEDELLFGLFRVLRDELDPLEKFRTKDLTAFTGMQVYDGDDVIEDGADVKVMNLSLSDTEALEQHIAVGEAENDLEIAAVEVENEVEKAAEIVLAMRSAITEAFLLPWLPQNLFLLSPLRLLSIPANPPKDMSLLRGSMWRQPTCCDCRVLEAASQERSV